METKTTSARDGAGRDKENDTDTTTLKNDDGRDVKFTGERIGVGTSYSAANPTTTRWTDIDIYRTTLRGTLIAHVVGRTQWQDETDRYTVLTASDGAALVDALERDNGGELGWVAKDALADAEIDCADRIE